MKPGGEKQIKKRKKPEAQRMVDIAVESCEAKQAIDIKVLDVAKTSRLFDYLLICSGETDTHLRAIEKEIDKNIRNNKIKGFRWQGVIASGWLVLDLGAVVIHILRTEEREYYNLEELWEKDAIIYHY